MDEYLKDAQSTGACSTLLVCVRTFRSALNHYVYQLFALADEWRHEEILTQEVVRHHRYRYNVQSQQFENSIADLSKNLTISEDPPSRIRQRALDLVDQVDQEIEGWLPCLDAEIVPISDWGNRLTSAAGSAETVARQLESILDELNTIEKAKLDTVQRVGNEVRLLMSRF